MTEDVARCRECNGIARINYRTRLTKEKGIFKEFRVKCTKCKFRTIYHADLSNVIQAWNYYSID